MMEVGKDLWGGGKCKESREKFNSYCEECQQTISLEERRVKEEKDNESLEAVGYM